MFAEGRLLGTPGWRSRVRPLRAEFVTPLPGGSGTPPGRHYDRPARSIAGLGLAVSPRPRKRGPELEMRSRRISQMPRWSAGRRASFAKDARASQGATWLDAFRRSATPLV